MSSRSTGWFFSLSRPWLNRSRLFRASLDQYDAVFDKAEFESSSPLLQVFSALVSCPSPSSPRTCRRLSVSELFWTVRLKASRPSACDGGRTASRCTRAAACVSYPTARSTSPAQLNQTRASSSVSHRTDTEPSWAKDPVSQSQVRVDVTLWAENSAENRPYTDKNMHNKPKTKRKN